MSAIPSYTLFCDGWPNGQECDSGTPNADLGNRTAVEARREARRHGWITGQPGGKDFCPDCVAEGQVAASNARHRAARKARR